MFIKALLATSLISLASGAYAYCPAGTQLSTTYRINESITTTVHDQAINEGALTASMPLDLANAELSLNPSNISLGGTQTLSIDRAAWTLKLRHFIFPWFGFNISATYTVTGSNGEQGVLSSPSLPTSVIPVTVVTRNIVQTHKNQYEGYINLMLDYSNARISGPHTGTLTMTVDCY